MYFIEAYLHVELETSLLAGAYPHLRVVAFHLHRGAPHPLVEDRRPYQEGHHLQEAYQGGHQAAA
jgi:hypothetical protein